MNFPNPSDSINDRMLFMQLRMQGCCSLDSIVDQTLARNRELLQERTAEIGRVLLSRQEEVEAVVSNLVSEIEAVDITAASSLQVQNLQKTAQELKEIQQGLNEKLHAGQKQLHAMHVHKGALLQSLYQLKQTLSNSKQDQELHEFLIECGERGSENIRKKGD